MAETFSLSELVIPGTYIDVRAEGLIGVGGLSTGNIGIVGTARNLDENGDPVVDEDGNPVDITGKTFILSDYATAQETLGRYDAFSQKTLNLTRAIELLYRNGARTVFARALDPDDAATGDFTAASSELVKDNVNILVAPELSTDDALDVLRPVLESAENNGRDVIAVVGSTRPKSTTSRPGTVQRPAYPGRARHRHHESVDRGRSTRQKQRRGAPRHLHGGRRGGSSEHPAPQYSPTNKVLAGCKEPGPEVLLRPGEGTRQGGVLVLEEPPGRARGARHQHGDGRHGPFKQITTRRITDFAKAGIRQASNPFIGRSTTSASRGAAGAIDGFLTTMVADEALIGYSWRSLPRAQDEIAGRAIVNAVIQPTFSIDFVAVTLVLSKEERMPNTSVFTGRRRLDHALRAPGRRGGEGAGSP